VTAQKTPTAYELKQIIARTNGAPFWRGERLKGAPMADKPILFSAPMVQALLAGTKTQTRRIIKPQPLPFDAVFSENGRWWTGDAETGDVFQVLRVPYAPGDRLWVRESGDLFREAYEHDPKRSIDLWRDAGWRHSADGALISAREYDPPLSEWIGDCVPFKRPSIHMPRWVSRLTLIVRDVRVQRLQEISEDDAIAEGVYYSAPTEEDYEWHRSWCFDCGIDPFRCIWNSIHGPDAWEANPWVCAITFDVIRANIDQIEDAAP
jgi:hypothetical protein